MKSSAYAHQVLVDLLHAGGNLQISLHTAVPRKGQNHHEITDANYRRASVPATADHWQITGNTATNLHDITFAVPAERHSIGHLGLGNDHLLAHIIDLADDELVEINPRTAPVIKAGTLIITES